MKPHSAVRRLILMACAAVMPAPAALGDIISFETSTWDHGSGPQTGWTDGETQGTTTVLGDVVVTITSTFQGTATPDPNRHMYNINDAPNFVGFAFVQDPSEANNSGTLANYMRLDFEFSEAVQLQQFTLTDIDQSSLTIFGTDFGYWDVLAAEGFTNGLDTVGAGIAANYTLNSTTFLSEVTRFGLDAVTPTGGGNLQQDPRSDASIDFGTTPITAFSVYYWNDTTANDGSPRQIIGLSGNAFEVVQTPEPSSLALCLLGSLGLTGARFRRRRTLDRSQKATGSVAT